MCGLTLRAFASRPPSNKNKTFKPHKNISENNSRQYQLKKYAEATLGSGNLRLAVRLPEGEDINEWLAVNSARTPDDVAHGTNPCAPRAFLVISGRFL